MRPDVGCLRCENEQALWHIQAGGWVSHFEISEHPKTSSATPADPVGTRDHWPVIPYDLADHASFFGGEPYNANVPTTIHRERTFAADGIEIRPAVLGSEEIEFIKAEVSVDHEILRRTGIRNLEKKFQSIAQVTADPSVLSIAGSLLGRTPRLVRALFFDKTRARNWFVAWHQDRTVTLNRRVQMDGWGPWTQKDGVQHVQPPRAVLDCMVTIRLHIDDADQDGGCLSVIPGSHHLGILSQDEIGRTVTISAPRACVVSAGDAVIMHPLVLHSSAKSRMLDHRRVVHLEYSSYELPPGVSWA